jgi:uncharacterized protein
MKLLIFSDIHADYAALEKLMSIDADYYFAAGDLVNWGRGLDQAGPILQKHAERMYVLPGNHESADDITRFCADFKLHDFHGQTLRVSGYTIAGLGCSNPTPFDTPGEYTEAEIEARLKPFAGIKPLVLICHCPPKETALDEAAGGAHFGSSAIRDFIDQQQPDYFFCGHIHEAAGVEIKLGRTHA